MTPFRVPSTGGTQIGGMWIEQQRAESCRGHGAGKGGQLAAARGGGVAGAERSASQAGVGALSRWGCESAAAWQLRASLQPSSPRGVSPSGARSGRQALCGLRADAGGGTLGGRRRTASGRRDPAALDESGRTLAPPASAKAGPYQFPEKLIPLAILHGIEGKPIPVYGDGQNIRDWLFVADHCEAVRVVLAKGRVGETYNIGGRNEKRNIEIVRTICSILDELRPNDPVVPHDKLITFVQDR